MSEGENFRDLKRQVDSIVGSEAKQAYLERYIRENKNVPLPLLAQIYEKLGKLHLAGQRERPWYFQKAASIWEMDAVLNEVRGGKYEVHLKKIAFKNALRNYKLAYRIHKKAGSWSDMNDLRSRQKAVERQLRIQGGPSKTFSIAGVLALFVLSFLFLSPGITGNVIVPLEVGESTGAGIILVILGFVFGVAVLWKWYRW